jgi:hypothetical protein
MRAAIRSKPVGNPLTNRSLDVQLPPVRSNSPKAQKMKPNQAYLLLAIKYTAGSGTLRNNDKQSKGQERNQ